MDCSTERPNVRFSAFLFKSQFAFALEGPACMTIKKDKRYMYLVMPPH